MTIDAWHRRITQLADLLEHRHPQHAPQLHDIRDLADQVHHAHPRAAAMATTGDGLRSPALAPGGPASVLDDEGNPMPPIADPVGELVANTLDSHSTTRLRRAEAARNLARTCLAMALTTTDSDHRSRLIRGAHHQLATALGHLHRGLPPTTAIRRIRQADEGDPGCTSCRRAGTYQPTRKGSDLCEWCYRWRHANGHLPALQILQARASGRRITTRLVAEVTAKRKAKKNPKRRKGR